MTQIASALTGPMVLILTNLAGAAEKAKPQNWVIDGDLGTVPARPG